MNNLNLPDGYTWCRCCECGEPIVMTEVLNSHVRRTKSRFFCPRGHDQVFKESTADILERRVTSLETRISELHQSVQNRDKTISNLRGQLTKARNRTSE